MERINEQMYNANVELVDRNRILDADNKILRRRIEKAIEYIEKNTYHDTPKKLQNNIYEIGELVIKSDFYIDDLLEILKGEDIDE